MKGQILKAIDVQKAMLKRYTPPEWALAFEVPSDTANARARRIDALALNCWPSRGLALHGFEIKTRRDDLLAELRNPAKQEEHWRYCDYFWLVTANGIVRKEDALPEGWGWLDVKPTGALFQRREADKTSAAPMGRGFLASFARQLVKMGRITETHDMLTLTEQAKALETQLDSQTRQIIDLKYELSVSKDIEAELSDVLRALVSAGLNPGHLRHGHVAAAIKTLAAYSATGHGDKLAPLTDALDQRLQDLKTITTAIDALNNAQAERPL